MVHRVTCFSSVSPVFPIHTHFWGSGWGSKIPEGTTRSGGYNHSLASARPQLALPVLCATTACGGHISCFQAPVGLLSRCRGRKKAAKPGSPHRWHLLRKRRKGQGGWAGALPRGWGCRLVTCRKDPGRSAVNLDSFLDHFTEQQLSPWWAEIDEGVKKGWKTCVFEHEWTECTRGLPSHPGEGGPQVPVVCALIPDGENVLQTARNIRRLLIHCSLIW